MMGRIPRLSPKPNSYDPSVCVAASTTLVDLTRLMVAYDTSALLISENGKREKILGIVTETNIVRDGVAKHLPLDSTTARQIMQSLDVVRFDCNLEDAMRIMYEKKIRHLPVVDMRNTPVTVIDIVKIAEALSSTLERELEAPVSRVNSLLRSFERTVWNGIQALVGGNSDDDGPHVRSVLSIIDSELRRLPSDPALSFALETFSVLEVVEHMAAYELTAINITDLDGNLVGVFTERDVLERVVLRQSDCACLPVGDVMTLSPVSVPPDFSTFNALALMQQMRCQHLPVVHAESQVPIGIIDILPLCHIAIADARQRHSKRSVMLAFVEAIAGGESELFPRIARSTVEDLARDRPEKTRNPATVHSHSCWSEEVSSDPVSASTNDEELKPRSQDVKTSKLAESQGATEMEITTADHTNTPEKSSSHQEDQDQKSESEKLAFQILLEGDKSWVHQDPLSALKSYSSALDVIKTDTSHIACSMRIELLARRGSIHLMQGNSYDAVQDYEGSIAGLVQMRDLHPNKVVDVQAFDEIYAGYAEALIHQHRYEEAVRSLAGICSQPRQDEIRELIGCEQQLLKSEGKRLYDEENASEALLFFTSALRINTALHYLQNSHTIDHILYANRGACYMKINDYRLAADDCLKCLELDSKYEKAWARLCVCLYQLELYDQAVARGKQALELFPHNNDILHHVSLATQKLLVDTDPMICEEEKFTLSQDASADNSVGEEEHADLPHHKAETKSEESTETLQTPQTPTSTPEDMKSRSETPPLSPLLPEGKENAKASRDYQLVSKQTKVKAIAAMFAAMEQGEKFSQDDIDFIFREGVLPPKRDVPLREPSPVNIVSEPNAEGARNRESTEYSGFLSADEKKGKISELARLMSGGSSLLNEKMGAKDVNSREKKRIVEELGRIISEQAKHSISSSTTSEERATSFQVESGGPTGMESRRERRRVRKRKPEGLKIQAMPSAEPQAAADACQETALDTATQPVQAYCLKTFTLDPSTRRFVKDGSSPSSMASSTDSEDDEPALVSTVRRLTSFFSGTPEAAKKTSARTVATA